MRIGIIGSGAVGQVLAGGFKNHGYDVRIASRSPEKLADFAHKSGLATGTFSEVAAWADALVLAVLGRAAEDAIRECEVSNVAGKLVMDTTNPISNEPPEDGVIRVFTGPNESLMERLQSAFPDAKFVKVFSSVGNASMVNPSYHGIRPTMFYCGNDAEAKKLVARVLDQFGWEGEDMGTVKAARAIEPLCQLWCIPGFLRNRWDHAFHLLRR
jgi:8-hydroxy-5-deazaflavin:NADPH oxidoreductase